MRYSEVQPSGTGIFMTYTWDIPKDIPILILCLASICMLGQYQKFVVKISLFLLSFRVILVMIAIHLLLPHCSPNVRLVIIQTMSCDCVCSFHNLSRFLLIWKQEFML